MKKEIIKRGMIGFPIGICIGHVISIFVSLGLGRGEFYPTTEEWAVQLGTQLNAVIAQTVLCGLIGTGFSMASVIWKIEEWSLAKQTILYFLASIFILFPVAYLLHWMPRAIGGVLLFFVIFCAVFLVIWIINYWIWRKQIQKINEKIREQG